MKVSITIDLSVVPQEKHVEQMRSVAHSLTNDPSSVEVICHPTSPKQISAEFAVPYARQENVVDGIGRQFRQVEEYQTCSIGFSRPSRRTRRSRGTR